MSLSKQVPTAAMQRSYRARTIPPQRSQQERNSLTLEYLSLAQVAVARCFGAARILGREEALQVATVALLGAAERWYGHRPFRCYALVVMRYELKKALRQKNLIRSYYGAPISLIGFLGEHAARLRAWHREDIDPGQAREQLEALLRRMPASFEKRYLRARMQGATQYESAQQAGLHGADGQHLEKRAIRLAREYVRA